MVTQGDNGNVNGMQDGNLRCNGDSNGDSGNGQCGGNSNGRPGGKATVTMAMDGLTATVVDGTTPMQRQ